MFPKRFSSLPPFLCKSKWHECFTVTCWASSPVGPLTDYRSVSTLLGLACKALQVLITTYFFRLSFMPPYRVFTVVVLILRVTQRAGSHTDFTDFGALLLEFLNQ